MTFKGAILIVSPLQLERFNSMKIAKVAVPILFVSKVFSEDIATYQFAATPI